MSTEDVLAAIDSACQDWTVGPDAMRCNAPEGEDPELPPGIDILERFTHPRHMTDRSGDLAAWPTWSFDPAGGEPLHLYVAMDPESRWYYPTGMVELQADVDQQMRAARGE